MAIGNRPAFDYLVWCVASQEQSAACSASLRGDHL
jgi:hypothetical protein